MNALHIMFLDYKEVFLIYKSEIPLKFNHLVIQKYINQNHFVTERLEVMSTYNSSASSYFLTNV